MNKKILLFLFILSFICFTYAEGQEDHVSVKIFNQVFPSYQMGPDDPNPFFKDFRVEGLNPARALDAPGSQARFPDAVKKLIDVSKLVIRLF